MRRLARFILSALLLCSLLLFPASAVRPAYAAGISVNTNADSTTTDGLCTLREAIANANNDAATYPDCAAGTGADTITFAGSYTITLGSSLPDVTDTDGLTITGDGTTNTIVQAAASAGTATYRVIKINAGTATFEYMTMRYGVEASGGAINVATGTLTLNYVLVSENQVNNSVATGLNGGAISINGGTININNSTLSNNSVTTSDTSNTARGNGGAIFVGSGTVNVNNTTLSGNSSSRNGGALYTNAGTSNISYSTIANNTSDSDNDATGDGGGVARNSGNIYLKSSIVAGNKKATTSSTDNDCTGTISSQDYNLTGSSAGCSLSGTHDSTITPSVVFVSLLGSLADNGGSTSTHALIAGSAAVDAIPNGTNSCGAAPFDKDQRGGTRPYNSSCDIGAYERRPMSVSTTGTDSGNCQLADCLTIAYAYSKALSGDTINVAAGTYTEASTVNMSSSIASITITGAGAGSTIWQAAASPGIGTHRHFKVSAGMTVIVQNMTLRYGGETSSGSINMQGGTLTLNNLVISDNQARDTDGANPGINGGAIAINAGTLTINNSAIINNSVTTTNSINGNGGAIYAGGGTINLNNVTISGNSAKRGGGGIYSNSGGIFNIFYSTIANNTADSDNDADGDGGGIRKNSTSGAINLQSSIVAGNKKGPSTDSDCSLAASAVITSLGYNLAGSSSGCSLAGTGDLTAAPATVFTNVLGPLANNGGSTYTHLLYGGNAAQDAIPNGTNSCGSGSFTQDQRGSARPYNGSCDMGAYESQDARPSVSLSTTAGSPTTTSPIPVTVTFSESVTGFTSGDVTAGNATVSNFSGSGASYSFDLVPSSDGTVTADIAAGVAQDSVLNTNTAASQLSLAYDGTPPPAPVVSSPASSSSTSDTTPTVSGTSEANSSLTIYFDSAVSGSTTADASGNWTYTPSAALSANASHTVKAKATDAAGNSSVDSNTNTFTVDTTAPTIIGVSRLLPAGATTNASSVSFFVTFSESSLSGVDATDFSLTTTGSISGASVSGVTYSNGASATVSVDTGSGDGTIRLDVADNDSIADRAGNLLGGSGAANGDYTSGQSFTIDKTSPTVTLSSTAASPTNTSPIPVTVTFSESVSGFTSGDITAGNGSISNFAGSGTTYTFDLTPSGDGAVTANIAAGVASDAAGNGNTAASQLSRVYDSAAPSVTAFTASSPSSSLAIPITAFSAADAGGVSGYLITTSSTPPSAGAAGWAAVAPASYSVAGDGAYTLYPWAKDAAGNVSAVYGSPASVTVETTAPSVVSIARAAASPSNAASVSFMVTFSEPVSGVDAGDFSPVAGGGLTGASIASVSGAGTTYTVSVSTGSGSGTLRLDLADNDSIADGSGNQLGGSGAGNGSFATGETYAIDKSAPAAGSLAAANIIAGGGATYSFTITFSDNLAIDSDSLDGNDIRVTGPGGFSQLATLVSATPAGNGSPRTATYQITAPGGAWDTADNGTYTIALEANQVFDTAGNPIGATSVGSFLANLSYITYVPLVWR